MLSEHSIAREFTGHIFCWKAKLKYKRLDYLKFDSLIPHLESFRHFEKKMNILGYIPFKTP